MNANTAMKINDAISQAVRCGETSIEIHAQVNRALHWAEQAQVNEVDPTTLVRHKVWLASQNRTTTYLSPDEAQLLWRSIFDTEVALLKATETPFDEYEQERDGQGG